MPIVEHMLTTVDNPYDPFTQFDEWYAWDESHGYHSSALLGRVVYYSHELSDADASLAIEYAIDEIVQINASGMHTKVAQPETITE